MRNKKTTNAVLFMSLIALGSWSASAQTYSGADLSGLAYVGDPGDAQYVPGTPDIAQLYTADAGLALTGDSPSVNIEGPFGTLSSFSASYDLLSSSVPAGTAPYWVLWVSPPGDNNFNDEVAIIELSAGATLNDTSTIHVFDPNNVLGSYWGDTLANLDGASLGPYTFGDMTVDWAGVEIGNWAVDDSLSASADLQSLTIGSVPDSISTALLLGLGLLGLIVFSFRQP